MIPLDVRAILRLWPGPTRPLGVLTRLDGSVVLADKILRRYGCPFDPRGVSLGGNLWTPWRLQRQAMAPGPDLSSGTASNDDVDADHGHHPFCCRLRLAEDCDCWERAETLRRSGGGTEEVQ